MLQLKTIHPETFELLKELSAFDYLNSFALAEGTALALQLGHRISIDLDFLTENHFDGPALLQRLVESFEVENSFTAVNSLSLFVKRNKSSVKLDFLRHNCPRLRDNIEVGEIRLFSLEDIAAMKLNAVANRGAKKDFYDIYALLSIFSLPELVSFFERKYCQMNSFAVVKSLTYFDDADLDPDPISLMGIPWEQVKDDINKALKASF